MTLTTPALLFPAISLLLLAYTNRFLVIAQLIRQLNRDPDSTHGTLEQIVSLQQRIRLIKSMQVFGAASFLCCTISMFSLFVAHMVIGEFMFGVSLVLLCLSLVLSLYEISISTRALNIELQQLKQKRGLQ
ncbi:MAG: DUF2721 domain-containing protein [Spartobacteria bacterium]|nr:DUF2721 domain-containing protein [Spartobacteria bacterium]